MLLNRLPYELVYTPEHPEPGLFDIRDRIAGTRERTGANLLYLLVEALCHLADLTAGEVFDPQAPGRFFHFPGGYALNERFLYHLNQRRFAAFALGDEERNIPAATKFWNHQIDCPHIANFIVLYRNGS